MATPTYNHMYTYIHDIQIIIWNILYAQVYVCVCTYECVCLCASYADLVKVRVHQCHVVIAGDDVAQSGELLLHPLNLHLVRETVPQVLQLLQTTRDSDVRGLHTALSMQLTAYLVCCGVGYQQTMSVACTEERGMVSGWNCLARCKYIYNIYVCTAV